MSIPGVGENAAATGDLDITGGVTLNGAGAVATVIDGGGIDRVFDCRIGSTAQINAVTIRNGNPGVGAGDGGGGVSNFAGTLTLNSSTVSSNTAGIGGGVANESGTITLNNSTVSANSAGAGAGGGIFNHGALTLNSSTVDHNQAGAGSGGGIVNDGGTVMLRNSTVSGNSAGVNGGGLSNTGTLLTLTNSTVSSNSAGTGGGIANTVNVQLKNTIVDNNAGGNCAGSIVSSGHNLSSDASCGFVGPGDLNGTNPLLGPLANNGGPTRTHALLPGSPALDAVPVADCSASTDQRGVSRPQGVACDTGAYEERETPTPTRTVPHTPSATPTPTPPPPLTPTPTVPCVPPPSGMVAWWPLDDVAGSSMVVDIGLPPANNGVPQPGPVVASPPGGPQAVPGNLTTSPADGALYFYTPTIFAEVPPSADFDLANSALTIDAWVVEGPFPVSLTASRNAVVVLPVVDKLDLSANTGFAFYVRIESLCPSCPPPPQPVTTPVASTTEIRLVFALGTATGVVSYTSAAVYTGTGTIFPFPTPPSLLSPPSPGWMHVAVSVDRSQNAGTFFFNGSPLATSNFIPAAGVNNASPVWIGGSRLYSTPTAPSFTEFTLNEIEIFNVAVPAAEIQAIGQASAGKCKPPAGVTPTPAPGACVGDCNGDGSVTVNELILMVNIALGILPPSACPAGDANHDGSVTITEIITAVNNALNGCACGFIGPRMCGGACPGATDVCQPRPDDSGCECRPGEPIPTATATPGRTATRTFTVDTTATPTRPATPTRTAPPSSTATSTARPTATPAARPTLTPTSVATRTATAPVPTPTRPATVTPTPMPACGFVGPRMCGGACPSARDVCQPLPDDSGCECRPREPVVGGPCGRGIVPCSYHEHCGAGDVPLECVDDTISSAATCVDDSGCSTGALPLCVGTSTCGANNHCYRLCP